MVVEYLWIKIYNTNINALNEILRRTHGLLLAAGTLGGLLLATGTLGGLGDLLARTTRTALTTRGATISVGLPLVIVCDWTQPPNGPLASTRNVRGR